MSRDLHYLVDMYQAALRVQSGSAGISKEELFQDWIRESALLHQIQIIGEAARHISDKFRSEHPEIPWRAIAGTRDIIVHAYNEVSDDEIWEIISQDIPVLIKAIEALIPPDVKKEI